MHLHHNKETKTSLFAKLTVCCSAMLADLVGVVVWAVYQVWLVASLTSAVQASLAALRCTATGTLTPTSVSCGQENHMSSQILPGLYPVSNRSLSFLYLVSGLYLVSIQSILPWKLWPRHSAPADSGERERRRSKTGSPAHHPPARQLPAAHCLPSQHPHTPAKHHWLQGTEQGTDSKAVCGSVLIWWLKVLWCYIGRLVTQHCWVCWLRRRRELRKRAGWFPSLYHAGQPGSQVY